jgi:hypothetical protein
MMLTVPFDARGLTMTVRIRRSKATKTEATVTEATEATEATAPITVGKPPATEATEATATEATADATEATAPDLQSAITQETEATKPPAAVDADTVATQQKAIFDRAIGRAAALATAENSTILNMGGDLQEAIDAFKPIIPKADWWRQRADTISDFEQRYRLRMNGRTPRAYQWLTCYHVHALASDDSKAIMTTGIDGRPFPMATMDAIGTWLVYTKADDTYAIKAGFEDHLDAIIKRVADDGLTTAQTTEAMKTIEADVRLANAAAQGGAKGKATEAKAQATKAKADRSKAIGEAVGKLAKAVESEAIGGATPSEILNHLAMHGLSDATGLVDPATMTPTEALAFASRLCELDRADIIFVMLTRFRAYEASATANAQGAASPRPALDDTPAVNAA